ncbi:hypothetical protein PYW07_009509 [Mythimna separata]|uniref:Uncharacterized protein n=1 Tax=Mythimna separata TaxID=271217 RepID=A0AAD7YBN4_MYTSE|nr:hypothetical protein PYW07_009509 [Mythimna separata]
MNRLCIALLLAVASASVASNVEPEVPGVAELDNYYDFDNHHGPIEVVPESRQNLIVGDIGPDDRLMARITHRVQGAPFLNHDQDITFRGPEYTNITGIFVTKIGSTQNALPTIRSGGLWNDFVIIRILGAKSLGYEYNIDIFASINCSNS